MNSFKKISAMVLFAVMASQAIAASTTDTPVTTETTVGYIDVYLVNNCSKEVEVRVRADGSSSTSKYKAGEKTKVSVKAGYEIYVDGQLYKKIEDADSGKEIKLCK